MDKVTLNSALRLTQTYGGAAKPRAIVDPFKSTISRASDVQDKVSIARPEKLAQNVDRLAAGSVGVPAVDTSSSPIDALPRTTPATYTSRGTILMQSQPGERNAAATGVAIGRLVDLNG